MLLVGGDGPVPLDGLPDVVVGCGLAVAGAGWAAGSCSGGFRCAGGERRDRADVPEPSSDSGGGEPSWWGGFLPGAAQVTGEGPGEAELGVDGDDQPGPAVGGLRGADLWAGPAEGLFEQPEGVFQVEAAQERLPGAVDVDGGDTGGRRPQPDGLGVTVAGQVVDLQADEGPFDDREVAGVVDLQADEGPFDDREVAGVVEPAGAVGQPGCSRFQLTAVACP